MSSYYPAPDASYGGDGVCVVYVLLLQENKIYVGFTERPIGERFEEHCNDQGAKWTTLYRPVRVLHLQQGGKEQENEMTLRMMDKYGWRNVRGGQLVPAKLICVFVLQHFWNISGLNCHHRYDQGINLHSTFQASPTELGKMGVLDVVETLIL